MKRFYSLFILSILVISLVSADGMIYVQRDDLWDLQKENQQLAAINYKDGFENLLISVDIDNSTNGQKAIWIFPVPAKAEDVAIDIVDSFPLVYGKEIEKSFEKNVRNTALISIAYALVPLPAFLWAAMVPMIRENSFGSMKDASMFSDVIVHEKISRAGLSTELVTSTHGNTLKSYLILKGFSLPQESADIFDYYIGENYTFVISYIEDLEKFKQESQQNSNVRNYGYYDDYQQNPTYSLAVSAKFPTDKIYFPLKPTSIYGSESIPVLIYVFDHVTPELYPKISQQAEVKYYSLNRFSVGDEFGNFFNGEKVITGLEYTTIKITAPSKYFEEDLWIDDSAPATIGFKDLFNNNLLIFGGLFYILITLLAGLGAGRIVFKEDLDKKRYILFGLWNLLTIMAFFIAIFFWKTKEVSLALESKLKQEKVSVSVRDYRKVWFMLLFYAFFIVGIVVLYWLMSFL